MMSKTSEAVGLFGIVTWEQQASMSSIIRDTQSVRRNNLHPDLRLGITVNEGLKGQLPSLIPDTQVTVIHVSRIELQTPGETPKQSNQGRLDLAHVSSKRVQSTRLGHLVFWLNSVKKLSKRRCSSRPERNRPHHAIR